MKRLATTAALLLVLAACSTEDTSTPTPSPTTATTAAATTDDSPRGHARAVVRETVPEWADLTDDQFDNAASQACLHLDEHPGDVDTAVAAVMTKVLDHTVDRSLIEYQTAAGQVTWFAGFFDCVEHRDAVEQWRQDQVE